MAKKVPAHAEIGKMACQGKLMAWVVLGAVALIGAPSLSFIATPSAGARGEPSAQPSRGQVAEQGLGFAASTGSAAPLACSSAAALALLAVGISVSGRRSGRSPSVHCSAVAVGQQVTWSGKTGKVAYVGPVDFAVGEWVGVALDGPGGMHDGSVLGKTYFSCPPGTGVFCQEVMLTGGAVPPAPAPAPTFVASAPSSPDDCTVIDAAMCVGAKVLWNGKAGTIKFVGPTQFAKGQWVGVELDAGGGMHDGSVLGQNYFDCRAGHGIFSAPAALKVTAPA